MDRASAFGGWPHVVAEINTAETNKNTESVCASHPEGTNAAFCGRTTAAVNSSCSIAKTGSDIAKAESDRIKNNQKERERNKDFTELFQKLKKQLPYAEAHEVESEKKIMSEAIQYISNYNVENRKDASIVDISLHRIGKKQSESPNDNSGKRFATIGEAKRKQEIKSKLNELDRQVLIWEGNDCYPETETKRSLLERATICVSSINSKTERYPTSADPLMTAPFSNSSESIGTITINPIVLTSEAADPPRCNRSDSITTISSFSSEDSLSSETSVAHETQQPVSLPPGITERQIENEDMASRSRHSQKERKRRDILSGLFKQLNEALPGYDGFEVSKNIVLRKATDCIKADNSRQCKPDNQIPVNINRLRNPKCDEKDSASSSKKSNAESERRKKLKNSFNLLDRELLVWEGRSRYEEMTSRKAVLERAVSCITTIKSSMGRIASTYLPVLSAYQPDRMDASATGFNIDVGMVDFDNNQPEGSGVETGGNQPFGTVVVTEHTLPVLNILETDFL